MFFRSQTLVFLYSSQFLLHCPPPPTHTHTHTHPTESGTLRCLLPGVSETDQADHDALHSRSGGSTVTSAEPAPGQSVEPALPADRD